MRCPEPPGLRSLTPSQIEWVNSVCNLFEEEWGRSPRLSIRDYQKRACDEAGPVTRLVLLRELLTIELELREEDTTAHDLDAYRALFPDPAETQVIEFVLGAAAKLEGAGRFRIVRPHAKGGLGEIFLAHDEQLDRVIALKRIRPELVENESSRARFVAEAEITGRLEHPSIAPVYALGRDRDKRPFYAMRFIDGKPFEQVIEESRRAHAGGIDPDILERNHVRAVREGEAPSEPLSIPSRAELHAAGPARGHLALRKLLGNFVAVCNAAAFAHSRGVLHRDIKPHNVMLGPFGETILVDWGLGKVFGTPASDARSGSADGEVESTGQGLSEAGSLLGTLPYMSPEQAERKVALQGPASDIYSLGATLYHVLTGRPPFGGKDHEELRRKVIHGEFPRPREVDRTIPPALDAIVRKAMSREPVDRYPLATALAEDIEHWLADEPVTAWREPIWARTGRRIRRHRTLVAGVAAGAMVGLAGLAVLAFVLAGKNRELETRRLQVVDQLRRAVKAEQVARIEETKTKKSEAEARKERDFAESERNRAERARDRVFKALHAILLTDKDEMLTEEARPYRQMLLDEGLRLSQEVLQESEGDPRAERLLAEALMMQAKILSEKGDRALATEKANKAIALFEGLVNRDPRDVHNRDGLAHLLLQFASLANDRETTRSAAIRSSEIYRALIRENPRAQQASSWIGSLALDLHNIGNSYFNESESAHGELRVALLRKAIEVFREGERFCSEQIVRDNPGDGFLLSLAHHQRYLCRAYRILSGLLRDAAEGAGSLKLAIESGEKSVSHFRNLADREPNHYQKRRELQLAQRELGMLFLGIEKWEDAIRLFKAARDTVKSMAQHHGKSVSRWVAIQEELASEDFNLINALTSDLIANDRLIHELFDEAYLLCDKLDVVRPLSRNLRKVHAYVTYGKADFLTESTGLPDVDLVRKAERILEKLVSENVSDIWARGLLALVRLELADCLASRGQSEEAAQFENGALAIIRGRPDVCFQKALDYASAAKVVAEAPSKLNARQREMLRRRYARRVVPMLREAVTAGFKDAARLRSDPAFASLHSDPEFRAIVLDMPFPSDPFAPLSTSRDRE